MDLLSPLLGLVIGLIVALTGAGGGILSVPLLVFVLGMPMQSAGPIGLLAVALSAGMGALLHLRDGNLRYKAAGLMALIGSLFSPLGLWLASKVPNTPLMVAFAGVLLFISIRMLVEAHRAKSGLEEEGSRPPCLLDQTKGKLIWTLPCARRLGLAGGLAGLLSGLLGVGGGFVIVPALKHATDLPIRSVVATSMGVLTLISMAGVLSATWAHRLDWWIALPFAAGALLGMAIGRQIAHHLKSHHIQQVFASVSLVVALGLLAKSLASH